MKGGQKGKVLTGDGKASQRLCSCLHQEGRHETTVRSWDARVTLPPPPRAPWAEAAPRPTQHRGAIGLGAEERGALGAGRAGRRSAVARHRQTPAAAPEFEGGKLRLRLHILPSVAQLFCSFMTIRQSGYLLQLCQDTYSIDTSTSPLTSPRPFVSFPFLIFPFLCFPFFSFLLPPPKSALPHTADSHRLPDPTLPRTIRLGRSVGRSGAGSRPIPILPHAPSVRAPDEGVACGQAKVS